MTLSANKGVGSESQGNMKLSRNKTLSRVAAFENHMVKFQLNSSNDEDGK